LYIFKIVSVLTFLKIVLLIVKILLIWWEVKIMKLLIAHFP